MHAKRTAMQLKSTPMHYFGMPMPFEDKNRGRHARLFALHASAFVVHGHAKCMARPCTTPHGHAI